MTTVRILQGDALTRLRELPSGSVHCIVTSPPYFGLRDYGTATWEGGDPACDHKPSNTPQQRGLASSRLEGGQGSNGHKQEGYRAVCGKCAARRTDQQIGLEPTVEAYVARLLEVFEECKRVLRDDGTLWLNLGDSYFGGKGSNGSSKARRTADERGYIQSAGTVQMDTRPLDMPQDGLKPKDLIGVPWRVAFALQAAGWWLRSAITWCKGNPLPESVVDRPTKASEMIFLLSKSPRYFYDSEGGRVIANGLNRVNGFDEVPLKLTTHRASACSLAAQSGKVSLHDEWTPYLILAAFLTMKQILVQERDDHFRQVLDVFENPLRRRSCWAVLTSLLRMNQSAQVVADIFEHLNIIISENDLQSETELRIRVRSIGAPSMKRNNGSFAIEEAREVVAKIIANAQAIRDTFAFDALSECFVNVDLVYQAIPFLECANANLSHGGNGVITESLLKKLNLALSDGSIRDDTSCVRHDESSLVGASEYDNTTKAPAMQNGQGHNAWDWWVINTHGYKGAHFATMPPTIVETCLRLGTSARGCCPACGAPHVRVVKKGLTAHDGDTASQYETGMTANRLAKLRQGARARGGEYANGTRTVDWRPTCACDAGAPIPCTVFDPFAGACTTLVAAVSLGRNAIGIELNASYIELAERRINAVAPLLTICEVA